METLMIIGEVVNVDALREFKRIFKEELLDRLISDYGLYSGVLAHENGGTLAIILLTWDKNAGARGYRLGTGYRQLVAKLSPLVMGGLVTKLLTLDEFRNSGRSVIASA
jgi:hypothetical protein